MKVKTLSVLIRRVEDFYVAECPEAGTESRGNTIEEAIANLREATEVCLRVLSLRDAPLRTSFEAAFA